MAGRGARSRRLEVTVANVRLAPEDQLEQYGLDPGLMHDLDLLRRRPTLDQKWLQGRRNRNQ